MNTVKIKTLFKKSSLILVLLGLAAGGLGIICGGLNTMNFLFWK